MQLGPFAIFFIFLGLKLSNTVDWSWWWVASPLLIASFLVMVFLTVSVLFINHARKRINNQQVPFKRWVDSF